MACKIFAEARTACGNCFDKCTVDAICEGDDHFTIHPELCSDCGAVMLYISQAGLGLISIAFDKIAAKVLQYASSYHEHYY